MLSIIVNHKNETLELKSFVSSDDKVMGPYLAMYYYRYLGYEWVNWDNESKPSLPILQSVTEDLLWEEYVYSIIVAEGTTPERLEDIIKNLGYNIDYVLERNNGLVNILHQTEYIEELKANGYTLTDVEHGEGNYSFGRGLYCLDEDNFEEFDSEWINNGNVYRGIYQGEYLRCVEDTDADSKSGKNKRFQQEIIIPFTETEVEWKINSSTP